MVKVFCLETAISGRTYVINGIFDGKVATVEEVGIEVSSTEDGDRFCSWLDPVQKEDFLLLHNDWIQASAPAVAFNP